MSRIKGERQKEAHLLLSFFLLQRAQPEAHEYHESSEQRSITFCIHVKETEIGTMAVVCYNLHVFRTKCSFKKGSKNLAY